MQTIASYLLRTPILDSKEFSRRLSVLEALFGGWLATKGADLPLEGEGFFRSKTRVDDTGIYRIAKYRHAGNALTEYTLDEKSKFGSNFTTKIALLSYANSVALYVTLTVSNPEDAVTQTFADAKCPAVIRDAINLFKDWCYFDNPLRTSVIHASDEDAARALAIRLKDAGGRKLPIVLVSELDGEELWPGIADQIAYDLSGAAEVYRLTDEASKSLTSEVGKINSCYLGAIRIYWSLRSEESFPHSTVWTASRLLPEDESNDAEYSSRFRAQLRNRVLAAMSASIEEPKEIASIKQGEIREKILELEARSADHEAALALIDELQKKNEELSSQLDEANRRCTSLAYQLRYAGDVGGRDAEDLPASNDDSNPPQEGEVRYYKKISEAGDHDKFRLVNDCDHNKWQGSKPADKARKGIIRREGRDDWKSMQHCAKCTGPGMWRVQW